jgi:hypothetical protein
LTGAAVDIEKREKLQRAAVARLIHDLLQEVTKTGPGQYVARCVFHSPDNNPSMSVNSDKGLVHCFSCGKAGDALEAYQAATGQDFATAAAELEKAAGITTATGRPSTTTAPPKTAKSAPPDPTGEKSRPPRRVAVYHYPDPAGVAVYRKEEWRPGPEGRNKSFIFRDRDGKKNRGGDPIPYNLDKITAAPPGAVVYFLEGEKHCDLLTSWGLIATTLDSGAASPWKLYYTEHFRGKHVVIIPDRDEPGEKYAARIARALEGTAAGVAVLRLPGLAEAEDLINWQGRTDPATGTPNDRARFLELAATAPAWKDATAPAGSGSPPDLSPPSPETVKRRRSDARTRSHSQGDTGEGDRLPRGSERLLSLFWDCPLYRDTAGATYIDIEGRLYPLDPKGRELRELMAHAAFAATKKTAGAEAINQALSVLSHRARTDGETLELFTRTGEADGAFWYDLGNNRAVKITPDGWQITARPLWFRSFNHGMAQPDPLPGGDPWKFFDFVNTRQSSRLLALCVLLSLFIPRIVRPLIHFIGCQGSGKTFAARLWKRLFDPSPVDLASIPRKDEDLDLLLFRNALLCLDNLSYLPPATADRLCSFISGAAIERRALFTDLDTTVLQSNCAVAVTSITDLHNRPDLTERTVRNEHDRITSDRRRTERELLAEFDAALPGILGGCFDLISKAMKIHPTVKLHDLPRLADFATWGFALAEAIGPGRGREFIRLLAENSAVQSHNLLDGDSLFAAIVAHLEAGKPLAGGFGECLAALLESAKPDKEDRSFPRNATGFRSHLARLEAPLEQAGIIYTVDSHRTAARRSHVEIRRKDTPPEEPGPPEDLFFSADELDLFTGGTP